MSTFLTAKYITLSYSSTSLFKELDLTINRGDKIGLIGHNGCGKSSLLKILDGQCEPNDGHIAKSKQCLMSYVEQHIPDELQSNSVLNALTKTLNYDEYWRAELLLSELGFSKTDHLMPVCNCSGGQQMRLLLARAVIKEPDLLLLDEPSNHLDLASLLWLENFLLQWKGAFVLVSHDQTLLDSVTTKTWLLRDQSLYSFDLPCSKSRKALENKDEKDKARYSSEQKEIDRIGKSAKRLANWGKVYDNEDLARKAKTMLARKERLEEDQTELSQGTPWKLKLKGDALPANRLLEVERLHVTPSLSNVSLFEMGETRIKSGDRIAILGNNGCGKTSLLNLLYQSYLSKEVDERGRSKDTDVPITFHSRCRLGYYDQSLEQLSAQDTLVEALGKFSSISTEHIKIALISAGFQYSIHAQKVECLSGGERARLLFVGLTLARYHLLFLDEPTNHLDMDGKDELIETLKEFEGATVLVSHDRNLIEESCNRFWLIQDGVLSEYFSAEEIYKKITDTSPNSKVDAFQKDEKVSNTTNNSQSEEEGLLERLIQLESLLESDLKRKPKHQKNSLQSRWRKEIEKINCQI